MLFIEDSALSIGISVVILIQYSTLIRVFTVVDNLGGLLHN